MIDVHAHVLPFVDDGSPDVESSLAMLREQASQGVTVQFLTPHYYPFRGYVRTAADNRAVFADFVKAAEGIGVRLILGNEIYYTIETLRDLRNGTVIPLGTSRHVLVEFSMAKEEEDIAEAIHNLKSIGYVPIVAHPERYPYLGEVSDFEIIRRMGGLIQLNAASLLGKYGTTIQKFCFRLLKLGLVDFVASDIHKFRKHDLAEAYALVLKKLGQTVADRVFANTRVLV
ncbi:MAG: CpsB/CapC family capsule biosynthesis tyrosine phosphatase [Candidatus Izemoplasmatales bacterium]